MWVAAGWGLLFICSLKIGVALWNLCKPSWASDLSGWTGHRNSWVNLAGSNFQGDWKEKPARGMCLSMEIRAVLPFLIGLESLQALNSCFCWVYPTCCKTIQPCFNTELCAVTTGTENWEKPFLAFSELLWVFFCKVTAVIGGKVLFNSSSVPFRKAKLLMLLFKEFLHWCTSLT